MTITPAGIPFNAPSAQSINQEDYGFVQTSFVLAPSTSQIAFLMVQVAWRPISLQLSNTTDLEVEVSLSDPSVIMSDFENSTSNALWTMLTAASFFNIPSPVVAVRVTNNGVVARTAKMIY